MGNYPTNMGSLLPKLNFTEVKQALASIQLYPMRFAIKNSDGKFAYPVDEYDWDKVEGVLHESSNQMTADHLCSVVVNGEPAIYAESTIAAGDYVTCSADGKAKSTILSHHSVGKAKNAAVADGGVVIQDSNFKLPKVRSGRATMPLVAIATHAVGDAGVFQNTSGKKLKILLEGFNVTVKSTGASTLQLGRSANGTSILEDLITNFNLGSDAGYYPVEDLLPGLLEDKNYEKILVAAGDTTVGAVISEQNTTGIDLLIELLGINLATQAAGAATIDIGVDDGGDVSSDTLVDGFDVNGSAVAFHGANKCYGTSGQSQLLWSNTHYITGTASADMASFVGQIRYKVRPAGNVKPFVILADDEYLTTDSSADTSGLVADVILMVEDIDN